MISDNYVTGDNIYLRELQNFFFEVLGMMSITHYGAIGDGRTDNYGPIQVAIDDAFRRGISYLYVPYGRFIYTGELITTDEKTGRKVIFVGNPFAKIVNIRTGEEIEIQQFGVNYTKKELDDLLDGKQDKLIAGSGISIIDNVISTTDDGSVLFTTSPVPTTWVSNEGTNTYGTWTISTDTEPFPESNTTLDDAFDGDPETFYKFRAYDFKEITLELPSGVMIKPMRFHVKMYGYDNRDERRPIIYGYNPATSEWEELVTLPSITSIVSGTLDEDFDVSPTTYYTKFRLGNMVRRGFFDIVVHEFQLNIGIIKDTN